VRQPVRISDDEHLVEIACNLLERLASVTDQDDPVPVAVQAPRDGGADARAASSDDRAAHALDACTGAGTHATDVLP
jgi:hypothetical protein